MSPIAFVVNRIVVGVLFWLVNTCIMMNGKVKNHVHRSNVGHLRSW